MPDNFGRHLPSRTRLRIEFDEIKVSGTIRLDNQPSNQRPG